MNQAQTFNDPFGLVKPNRKPWYWQPRAKEPQKQYPVYVPTLDEPWITVRFVAAKNRPSAAIGNYADLCLKLMSKLTDIPRPASEVSKDACVTLEQSLNALRRMAAEGSIGRTKAYKKWRYFSL
jgi:hypothetical protein